MGGLILILILEFVVVEFVEFVIIPPPPPPLHNRLT